jgi:hypothetical protein
MINFLDEAQVEKFKKEAVAQGYSPDAINAFVSNKKLGSYVGQQNNVAPYAQSITDKGGLLNRFLGGVVRSPEKAYNFARGAAGGLGLSASALLGNKEAAQVVTQKGFNIPGWTAQQSSRMRGEEGDLGVFKEGISQGANISQYTLPVGKGVNALLTGGVRGFSGNLSQQVEGNQSYDLGSAVGATATGSVLEGILGNIGKKKPGEMNKADLKGYRGQKELVEKGIKTTGNPNWLKQGVERSKFIREHTSVGSDAIQKGVELTEQRTALREAAKEAMASNTNTVPVHIAQNQIRKFVNENLNPSLIDKPFLEEQLTGLSQKAQNGGLDGATLLDWKASLPNVEKAYMGSNATTPQTAAAIERAIKGLLDLNNPEASTLLSQLAPYEQVLPGLGKATGSTVPVPIIGSLPIKPALQRVSDVTTRAGIGISKATSAIAPSNLGAVGTGITKAATIGAVSPQAVSSQQPQTKSSTFSPPTPPTQDTQKAPNSGMKLTPEVMLKAYLTLPAKDVAILEKMYKIQQDADKASAEGGMDASAKSAVRKLDNAGALIDQFEKAIGEMNLNENALGARTGGLVRKAGATTGLIPDTNLRAFTVLRNGTKSLMARTFGEVGNLNAQEQESALGLIPDVTDTREEASAKIYQLRAILSSIRSNY